MKTFVLCGILLLLVVNGVAAWEPVGYPYLVWSEMSRGHIEGLKFEGAAEQGVDWFQVMNTRLVLNTFGAFRWTLSDRPDDFWNRKLTPVLGVKLKWNIPVHGHHWNQAAVGARTEYVHYLGSGRDTTQVLFFLQIGFGGDWSAKR